MREPAVIERACVRLGDFSSNKDLIETDSRVAVYGLDGHAGHRLPPVCPRRKFAGASVRSAFPAGNRRSDAGRVAGVYSFVQTGAADFSVSDTGHDRLPELCQPIAAGVGGPGGTPACHHRSGKYKREVRTAVAGWAAAGDGDLRYRTRRAGPLDLRCQNELGTAIDSGTRPPGCPCLVAGFDDAGVPAHRPTRRRPGSMCAAWDRRIRKKRCRPPISRCRPTGPPMGASSLS